IGVVIALAFVALTSASTVLSDRVSAELERVRSWHLPRLALGPKLSRDLEGLARALQDAVAAKDLEALAATAAVKDRLVHDLTSDVLEPGTAAALRAATTDYYLTASDVSRRLIAAETGEELVDAVAH